MKKTKWTPPLRWKTLAQWGVSSEQLSRWLKAGLAEIVWARPNGASAQLHGYLQSSLGVYVPPDLKTARYRVFGLTGEKSRSSIDQHARAVERVLQSDKDYVSKPFTNAELQRLVDSLKLENSHGVLDAKVEHIEVNGEGVMAITLSTKPAPVRVISLDVVLESLGERDDTSTGNPTEGGSPPDSASQD